jgi:hypothetical protein
MAIMVAGLWITVSEFLRNEVLFKYLWVRHYETLKLTFATTPVNGMLWLLWSMILAWLMFRLLKRTCFLEAVSLSWLAAFVMMWLVVYNLQVLPLRLLIFAVPLSLLEVAVAGLIIRKLKVQPSVQT